MQAATDKTIAFINSASQGITSIFQSKVEIRSETPIMGIPVWTLFVGIGSYILWNNYTHARNKDEMHRLITDMEKSLIADNAEKTRQIRELRTMLSEIIRDDKDALRRENEVLKERLKALEK